MQVSKELIGLAREEILNFRPTDYKGEQVVNLGSIGTDLRVVHGLFSYPTRYIYGPDQPVTLGRTIGSVLAIEKVGSDGTIEGRKVLAYRQDIASLTDEVAIEVLNCIAASQSTKLTMPIGELLDRFGRCKANACISMLLRTMTDAQWASALIYAEKKKNRE